MGRWGSEGGLIRQCGDDAGSKESSVVVPWPWRGETSRLIYALPSGRRRQRRYWEFPQGSSALEKRSGLRLPRVRGRSRFPWAALAAAVSMLGSSGLGRSSWVRVGKGLRAIVKALNCAPIDLSIKVPVDDLLKNRIGTWGTGFRGWVCDGELPRRWWGHSCPVCRGGEQCRMCK